MRLLASNDYVKDNSLDLASENNQTSLTNGKSQYSLLQFALQNFVQAIDKYVFKFDIIDFGTRFGAVRVPGPISVYAGRLFIVFASTLRSAAIISP